MTQIERGNKKCGKFLRRMAGGAGMALLVCVTSRGLAADVVVTGSIKYNSPTGEDRTRGMATTMYCGNSPESWVRGNAVLDRSSGLLSMTVQLETDSVAAGPAGRVIAVLKDAAGTALATVTSKEIGTGGKGPGSAAIRTFDGHVMVDPSITTRVSSIYLDAQCTGAVPRMWNVSLGTVKDALSLIPMLGTGVPPLEEKPALTPTEKPHVLRDPDRPTKF